MNTLRILVILLSFLLLSTTVLSAQENSPGTGIARVDNPSEWAKFTESCGSFQLKSAGDCADLLFTGQPIHIAVGSLPPQNGFGGGVAVVKPLTPTESWKPSLNADAVATGNASWRAGVYFKLVHTPKEQITVEHGKPEIKSNLTELPEYTVVNVYAQAISLNKLTYFGLGPLSTEAGRSYFGMQEVIVGTSVVKPIATRFNIALVGELNGRFVDLRSSTGNSSPSIGVLYTEATAPGLATQPAFLQLGEGIRMRPTFWEDRFHLDYNLNYQQFIPPGNTFYSFQRVNIDLANNYAIYHLTTRFYHPRDADGPDECAIALIAGHPSCSLDKKQQVANCNKARGNNDPNCKAISRDLQGSIGFRFLFSTSVTQGQNQVPFYFQPTLGGGDLNGNPSLSSYQDYRFRAPNVLLLRESFEHEIWGPLGFAFIVDEGKVALTRGEFGSSPWIHSYSAGLTLRAGGFPQVFLLFSWGGNEGTHTIANVNASLLGGSTRPSLF